MRTTLDIDNDVLHATKEIAARENRTAGAVISDLLRKSLTHASSGENVVYRNGFPQIQTREKIITPEMIEAWLDEDS
jgi:hypothetical protein